MGVPPIPPASFMPAASQLSSSSDSIESGPVKGSSTPIFKVSLGPEVHKEITTATATAKKSIINGKKILFKRFTKGFLSVDFTSTFYHKAITAAILLK
jgi:hypothetical protein